MAKAQQFEQQLAELETLVEQMESGEISLEQSLESFEKGIKLARACQKSLQAAELKVKTLLANNELIDTDQSVPSDE